MNKLIQLKNNLIGDSASYKKLQKKDNCRILLISDSHGAFNLLKEIIMQNGKNVDCLVFCGDGSYDISKILEDAEKNKELQKSIPDILALVRGNGDPTRLFYKDFRLPSEIIFSASNKNIFVTHGNKQGVYYGTEELVECAFSENCQLAFYGHTHIPDESNQKVYVVNSGSVGNPRRNSPHSFAIVEITKDYNNAIFYRTEITESEVKFIPYFPEKYI